MDRKISPRAFYNQFAPNYESTLADPKCQAQYVHEAIKLFLRNNHQEAGRVLDIGCGTGLLKELLQKDFEYTGIDISENMLFYAEQRGYRTIHRAIESALVDLPDRAYDFVFALSCLLFVEEIQPVLAHINRIATQSILLSLDEITEAYNKTCVVHGYNHTDISIPNAKEDYMIHGWTASATGIAIQTRMIYIEK